MSCSRQRVRWKGRATARKVGRLRGARASSLAVSSLGFGALGFGALGVWALAGGCQVRSNARLEIGSSLRLPATDPSGEPESRGGSPESSDLIGGTGSVGGAGTALRPSPASLDRSDWAAREFHVPYDGVRHYPSHTRQFVPAYATRSRGTSPTLLSALDLGDASYGMGVSEGVGNLGVALFDALVLVPEHFFFDPFWEMNESPQWGGERVPMRSWIGEVLSPEVEQRQALEVMGLAHAVVVDPGDAGDSSTMQEPTDKPDGGSNSDAPPTTSEAATGTTGEGGDGASDGAGGGGEPGSGGI